MPRERPRRSAMITEKSHPVTGVGEICNHGPKDENIQTALTWQWVLIQLWGNFVLRYNNQYYWRIRREDAHAL